MESQLGRWSMAVGPWMLGVGGGIGFWMRQVGAGRPPG